MPQKTLTEGTTNDNTQDLETTIQKQAYKLENLRNKIRYVEQLEDSP
jgi:hypothetical protein